jgi:hypothetical protein
LAMYPIIVAGTIPAGRRPGGKSHRQRSARA